MPEVSRERWPETSMMIQFGGAHPSADERPYLRARVAAVHNQDHGGPLEWCARCQLLLGQIEEAWRQLETREVASAILKEAGL